MTFGREGFLKRHLIVHSIKMIFPFCESNEPFQTFLISFPSTTQTDRPFECDQCERSFKWKITLKDNQKNHSSKLKLFFVLLHFGVVCLCSGKLYWPVHRMQSLAKKKKSNTIFCSGHSRRNVQTGYFNVKQRSEGGWRAGRTVRRQPSIGQWRVPSESEGLVD